MFQNSDLTGRRCPDTPGASPSQYCRVEIFTSWHLSFYLGTSRHDPYVPHIRHQLNFQAVKLEDGSQHKNLRVWSVSTGQELSSFTQKYQEDWDVQYTISESHAIRLVGSDIQVFRPAEWDKGVVDKLRIEGATSVTLSPGLNPSVAVFIAEKKVCTFVLVVVDIHRNCFLGSASEHQDLQSPRTQCGSHLPKDVFQSRSCPDQMEYTWNTGFASNPDRG